MESGQWWKTEWCPSCYESHHNYKGKLDKKGEEYVICGNTNKKCMTSNSTWKQDPDWTG